MTNNPYTLSEMGREGRKEWNDRYMNMTKANKNLQISLLVSMGTIILLGLVVARLATSSRVEPFMVETNQGMPYAIQTLHSGELHDQKIINFAANQFIVNSRTVLSDPDAEKILLNKVYSYTADNAINYLHDYYQHQNPITVNGQYSVEVNIVNSMPLGKNIWQVVWDEIKHANDGSVESKTRWMANLTYQFGQVNSKLINDNPFGLYITNISWSQSTGA